LSYHDKIKHEAEKYGWGLILIHKDVLKEVIEKKLKEQGKIRILDVGSWNCLLWNWIKSNFSKYIPYIKYIGVDVLKPPNLVEDAEFHVMSPTYLMFPSNYFDIVTMIEVLEHIFDYTLALREAYRVLKHNGILFIQSVICYDHNALLDETHYHVLHPATLERLLNHLGFEVLEIISGGNFVVVAKKK